MNQRLSYQEILEQLISFPTISDQSNLDMITWIEDYLASDDVQIFRLENATEKKSSLLVKIGPDTAGGIIFSGHTDVVPVASQPWQSDPFQMLETETHLIGRGVCDMKGFIACVLEKIPAWSRSKLQAPIYCAFSYDEEVGCDKAPEIIEKIKKLGGEEAWVIVGEPTLMQPIVGQKGIVNLQTTIKGKAAHSSQILHQGVSAVHEGSKFVVLLENIMKHFIEEGIIDDAFNVPHSSLHAGIIEGGIAYNVLAEECVIQWEIRNLPQQDMKSIIDKVNLLTEQEIVKQNPLLKIETILTSPVVPGLINDNNDQVLKVITQALNAEKQGYVAYATEAGHFQTAGFETVILGPGSIEQAHQANEWIEKKQLKQCSTFLDYLVEARCR